MEASAFETWLGRIAVLSEPQRRQAWQALALSEAVDDDGIEGPGSAGQVAPRVERAAEKPPAANSSGAASVAELGQRRVDTLGCPHCGHRAVQR
jgi:hypothetical protein